MPLVNSSGRTRSTKPSGSYSFGLPVDVVIQRSAHVLDKRSVDFAVHGQTQGTLPGCPGGELQPGQKGLKLRE